MKLRTTMSGICTAAALTLAPNFAAAVDIDAVYTMGQGTGLPDGANGLAAR